MLSTEILVIGGGSTGLGVVRDAARRGFRAVLVEKGDLAHGTTGRFHGLLHSGARYAVKDPVSAKECIEENRILRRIAADCIEDSGGLFVATPWDDPSYGDEFVRGCQATGVPAEEITPAEALRREPRLNRKISRAFVVPDASIDSFKTLWANARDAQAHGAQILTYDRVQRLLMHGQTVAGAVVQDVRTGEELEISADFTVNASGAWAGQIAAMAGLKVTVLAGKGIMIAMNHRLVQTCVNRLKPPSDGDIIVPIRTVCVIGTTDVRVPNPDEYEIEPREVQFMLDEGEKLVPGFRQARALRVWAGVRPLYQPEQQGQVTDTRDVSRTYTLIDHPVRDGVQQFLTITGGKFTTYRAMAEVTMDSVCRHLGTQRPSTTATTPLPDSEDGRHYWLGARLAQREATLQQEQLICECELINRRRLEEAFQQRGTANLDDMRRQLRLGMGPCQGGFCIYRATGVLHEVKAHSAAVADAALCSFLQERWKGVAPLLWGDQLRQARLDDWIFQGLLDVEHLPPDGQDTRP
jgi:glycerol-3-phosphate dehydrogenase